MYIYFLDIYKHIAWHIFLHKFNILFNFFLHFPTCIILYIFFLYDYSFFLHLIFFKHLCLDNIIAGCFPKTEPPKLLSARPHTNLFIISLCVEALKDILLMLVCFRLSFKMWSQNCNRMARFGLWICQILLTKSCFGTC